MNKEKRYYMYECDFYTKLTKIVKNDDKTIYLDELKFNDNIFKHQSIIINTEYLSDYVEQSIRMNCSEFEEYYNKVFELYKAYESEKSQLEKKYNKKISDLLKNIKK